jgi:molecular chaperone DnaK
VATKLIDKNTTIPTKKTETFTTADDYQTTVTIHVIQGERPMAADNISLGMFNLTGIPPAPRGVPKIEVTFDIDTNGILNVSAKDLATGKENKITITASTKLSDAEKERLIKEAQQYAEQDRKKLEEVQLRNDADSMIYTSEKLKGDLHDKLSSEQVSRIDGAVKDLRDALAGKETDRIKEKLEGLKKVMGEIGASAYQNVAGQQAGAAEGAAAGAGPSGSQGEKSTPPEGEAGQPKGKVYDADFKEG